MRAYCRKIYHLFVRVLHIFWPVLQQALNAFHFLSEIYVFEYASCNGITFKTASVYITEVTFKGLLNRKQYVSLHFPFLIATSVLLTFICHEMLQQTVH